MSGIYNDVAARLIAAALTGRSINIDYLLEDEKFLEDIQEKAKNIYANSSDSRSLADVENSCFWGELGEQAIFDTLNKCRLMVQHNDEKLSGEYHWDLLVENRKIEVKFQSAADNKEYFSFNQKSHDDLMRAKWNTFDYIIPFYVKNNIVIPWMLISSKVLNPEKDYYVPSKFNSGYYLKNGKACNALLALTLNSSPN